MKKALSTLLLCVFSPALCFAASDTQRELEQKCEQARAAKIRPLQQQKVDECVAEPAADRGEKKTRAQCEDYWRDYGWGHATGPGRRKPGMFEDIPECVAAHKARQSGER
jgi:hypothetical protein